MSQEIKQLRKRKGEIVDFDKNKIEEAIYKSTESIGKADKYLAKKLSQEVIEAIVTCP